MAGGVDGAGANGGTGGAGSANAGGDNGQAAAQAQFEQAIGTIITSTLGFDLLNEGIKDDIKKEERARQLRAESGGV